EHLAALHIEVLRDLATSTASTSHSCVRPSGTIHCKDAKRVRGECKRFVSLTHPPSQEALMQSNPDLLDALRTDLAELTALHAPSGAEQAVIARLRELFAPLVDALSVDPMGNLSATREGPPSAPHVVVSAHADEIGALVASIEPDGFVRLLSIGGVQPRLLEGRAVWVGGRSGV